MKGRFVFVSVVIGLFLMVGAYVMAQPVGAQASLVMTTGEATVFHAKSFPSLNANEKISLASGDVLLVGQGDRIELGATSTAVLTMPDGSRAELEPGTVLELSQLAATDDHFQARFTLLAGGMVNRVQRLLGVDDAYEVRTPSATASVRGTVFTVQVLAEDVTYVGVAEGTVAVSMAGEEVAVPAGYEVTAVSGQPLQVQPQTISGQAENQTTIDPAPVFDAPETAGSDEKPASAPTEAGASVTAVQDEKTAAGASDTENTANPSETAVVATAVPVSTQTEGDQSTQPTATSAPTGSTTIPPTATRKPTNTPAPPTATIVKPTATTPPTNTPLPLPTNTPPPTNTPLPPPTNTPLPPPTNTPLPPPTATPEPPPTNTPEPEKVTLCHNGNTIEVDPSSVQGHLDHGDYLGPCQ